jgi:hypothetical protein
VDGGLVVLSAVVVEAVVVGAVVVVAAVVVAAVVVGAVVVGLSRVVGVTRVVGLVGIVDVEGECSPLDPLVRTSTRMMTTMMTRTAAAMAIHKLRLLFRGR